MCIKELRNYFKKERPIFFWWQKIALMEEKLLQNCITWILNHLKIFFKHQIFDWRNFNQKISFSSNCIIFPIDSIYEIVW